jgi:MscS family membrane protein
MRTLDGHLVTIPNSKLIEDIVENIAARPYMRRVMNITITYDTPPAKIEEAVQIIRELLEKPFMAETFDMAQFPPRVFFNEFNADSLNISVTYWYQLSNAQRDWWTFQAQAHEFNLRLIRAFRAAQIDFAFPTHTVYLAGDPQRLLSVSLGPVNGVLPATAEIKPRPAAAAYPT